MRRVSAKIPIWLGNIVEITGIVLGFLSLLLIEFIQDNIQKLFLLLLSWFCFWFFSHCLTHFVVGKIFGVKFLYYFVGPSSLVKLGLPVISSFAKRFPVLGIKIDNNSLRKISYKKQALVFASGAFASMIFPIIPLIYSFYLETWIASFISFITVFNIIFTLFFSTKVGDLYRAMKVLRSISK